MPRRLFAAGTVLLAVLLGSAAGAGDPVTLKGPQTDGLYIIGTGTTTENYPLNRTQIYSAWEAIYLQSELDVAGSIKKVAFYEARAAQVTSPTSPST
jgi:hypothetical protein